MTRLTDAKIAELRRLHAAATPGPWTRTKPARDADGWSMGVAVAGTPGRQTIYADPPGGSFPSSDCDLIVALRNALPALLAEIEEWRQLHAAMEARVAEINRAYEDDRRIAAGHPAKVDQAREESDGS